jgi:fucose permease
LSLDGTQSSAHCKKTLVDGTEKRSRTLLIGIAFSSFIVMGLNAGLLGVAWPSIRASFGISLDAIGTLMLLSTAVSLAISFNSGPLIAKMGLGPLVMISCILSAAGFLGYALSPAWGVMLLFGMVSSIGTTAINAGLNTYFATNVSAGLMNWLHACFGLGATVSPVMVMAVLNLGYSWRWGYALVALSYGMLGACLAFTLERWPLTGQVSIKVTPNPPTRVRSRDTLKLPAVWLSLALFFTFTGMEGSAGQWPYTLFTEARSVDPATAGFWASVFWASMTAGRMFFGIAVGRIGTVPLIRTCMSVTVCGAVLIWWNPSDALSFLGLALIGFSGAPLFPVLTSNTPERLGPDHAANAIGFQMTAVRLGLATIPALVGVLAQAFGLEVIGLGLFVIAITMLTLYELTIPRSRGRWTPPKGGATAD